MQPSPPIDHFDRLSEELLEEILKRWIIQIQSFDEFQGLCLLSPRFNQVLHNQEVLQVFPLMKCITSARNPWIVAHRGILNHLVEVEHPAAMAIMGFYMLFRTEGVNPEGEYLLEQAISKTSDYKFLALYMRGFYCLMEALGTYLGEAQIFQRGLTYMEESRMDDPEYNMVHRRYIIHLLRSFFLHRPEGICLVPWIMNKRYTHVWHECTDNDCARKGCETRIKFTNELDVEEDVQCCSSQCKAIYEVSVITYKVNLFRDNQ